MAEDRKCFNALGYEIDERSVDKFRKVNVTVGRREGVRVELLAPLEGSESPIDGYLTKSGSTTYHIMQLTCFI